MIGISGVILEITFEIRLFTSKSPLLTGVLSDLTFFIKPFFLNPIDKSPAVKKHTIKPSTIFYKFILLFTQLS